MLDIDWTSETFKDSMVDLYHILAEANQPTTYIMIRNSHLRTFGSKLQDSGRWKAAQISILGEFFSSAFDADTMPFGLKLTYDLVCSSILTSFDSSLAIEAVASCAPLLLLKTPTNFELKVSETGNKSVKCRIIVEKYLLEGGNDTVQDFLGQIPESVIFVRVRIDLLCVSAIEALYSAMTGSLPISPPLSALAETLFESLPKASPVFTRHHLYPFLRIILTAWILCQDALSP
ncbi:hypothetical protein K435DRAFT_860960 [Dendrothele bispora CBS 962.96]|uniref:Uncharacterized protein n=1 Tax=Dendrothele bispora (strain CBS 962.96) TaxID=1314807 RepID=A0A4S8LWR2_DENBC|nr:hypothetical protein K435DRAFT_860960 [Dendrothele bispora CBS 962.96]